MSKPTKENQEPSISIYYPSETTPEIGEKGVYEHSVAIVKPSYVAVQPSGEVVVKKSSRCEIL